MFSFNLATCLLILSLSLKIVIGAKEQRSIHHLTPDKVFNHLNTVNERASRRSRAYPTDDEDFGSGSGDGEWRESEITEGSDNTRKAVNLLKAEFGTDLIHEIDKNNEPQTDKPNGYAAEKRKYSNGEVAEETETLLTSEPPTVLSTQTSTSTSTEPPHTSTSSVSTSITTEMITLTPISSTSVVKTTASTSTAVTSTTTKATAKQCANQQCPGSNVIVAPKFQSLLPGRNISVSCQTPYQNESIFEWYFVSEENVPKLVASESGLFIQEAQLEQTGLYECVTSDRDGCCKKSASAKVVVYLKPEYVKHILIMVGVFLSVLVVCVLSTVLIRKRYRNMMKRRSDDEEVEKLQL